MEFRYFSLTRNNHLKVFIPQTKFILRLRFYANVLVLRRSDIIYKNKQTNKLVIVRADLHGTTLSRATSLRQAYDMYCIV